MLPSSRNESDQLNMIEVAMLPSQAAVTTVRCETTGSAPADFRPLCLPEMLGNAYRGGYVTKPADYVPVPPKSDSDVPPSYGSLVSDPSGGRTRTPVLPPKHPILYQRIHL